MCSRSQPTHEEWLCWAGANGGGKSPIVHTDISSAHFCKQQGSYAPRVHQTALLPLCPSPGLHFLSHALNLGTSTLKTGLLVKITFPLSCYLFPTQSHWMRHPCSILIDCGYSKTVDFLTSTHAQ